MKGPLSDTIILELCTTTAGSYTGMLLADMGARLLKVHQPRTDGPAAPPGFRQWDRGKESIGLSLISATGRKVARSLAHRSDAFLTDLGPRLLRRLRLHYEHLSMGSPRLIYCSITPFGEKGPLAHSYADDTTVAAFAGIFGDQGGPSDGPRYVYLPIPSYGTALLATYSVCSALWSREQTGSGQKLEVSLLGGALAMQSGTLLLAPGITPVGGTRRSQQGANPVYRLYRCADDAWLFLGCGNHLFWNKCCIALGKEDLVSDPRFADAPWGIPPEHYDFLTSLLAETFARQTRDFWLTHLSKADVPCSPVNTREEFTQDPQVVHNKMFVDLEDPSLGPTKQIGLPISFSATPTEIQGAAPLPGQHTRAILRELGLSERRVARLLAEGTVMTPAKGTS